jgi:hypothetical protein
MIFSLVEAIAKFKGHATRFLYVKTQRPLPLRYSNPVPAMEPQGVLIGTVVAAPVPH